MLESKCENKVDYIMLKTLLNEVVEIVQKAKALIKDSEIIVYEKESGVNIVTSSDIEVQRFLCQELKKLMPEAGLLCEEENLQQITSEYIWVIDPIDGTMNYARGIQECAISIGLVHEQTAILGVVANIWKDEIFTAYMNGGARRNGELIKVSTADFAEGILCTAMSLYKKELAKVCSDIIYEVYMQCNDVRRFGSCALELCYLAAGQCDLYFEIRVFPWDCAAASVILKEAGGILSGFDEGVLTFTAPTLLVAANNYSNYKKLLNTIKKHIKGEVAESISWIQNI